MGSKSRESDNQFIMHDYHKSKPFSSFLPGIAGEFGIPIWAFYVNRGQGVSSFGIQDKNNPIMEFFPANSAYQYVSTYGFRTFIKLLDQENLVVEPFNQTPDTNKRIMGIEKDRFFIQENLDDEGISIRVTYATTVNSPFGGLIRKVEIHNNNDETINIEIVDGMPALLPYGIENTAYKEMSNLMRSWMEVTHTESKIPFYKLRSSTKDEALVKVSNKGYFYMSNTINDENTHVIYDANVIFDYRSDLQKPIGFMNHAFEELIAEKQVYANKVPAAFQVAKATIPSNDIYTINSVIGYCDAYERIEAFSHKLVLKEFVNDQLRDTKDVINQICSPVEMETGNKLFDQYMSQSYLDNIMRGGSPLVFKGKKNNHIYHLYSRKHGDQERDYNFFSLEPSCFSQGNGNFRDVNQNRRNDLLFTPEVKDFNIWQFYSLIQTDGNNPLSVQGTRFTLSVKDRLIVMDELIKNNLVSSSTLIASIEKEIERSFTPGSVVSLLMEEIDDKGLLNKILESILYHAKQEIAVQFGEGFWSDHFTYNQDLIDNYLYIYPDKMEALLCLRNDYGFYNAPYFVLPRNQKYCLTEGNKVRQYNAIKKKHDYSDEWVTDINGKKVETNLLNKILTVCLTKFMNLDAFGMGIEMEGDKPGWNDALNGLPGLLGSGMSETIELKRVVTFLLTSLSQLQEKYSEIGLLEDSYNLTNEIHKALLVYSRTRDSITFDENNIVEHWHTMNNIKEAYREHTRNKFSSDVQAMNTDELIGILSLMDKELEVGIRKAIEFGQGKLPSYFAYEVVEYKLLNQRTEQNLQVVEAVKFKARALPMFLEAPARYIKSLDKKEAIKVYRQIRDSEIFDAQLKMYKTSESLNDETLEIGRIRAFTPGWLERESVFAHMTYKYLLGMLKAGLYNEFFEDMKTNLVPFLDPEVYGRPTTENSSFIASSVNPDSSVVGQGFVARLSGSTAEVLSMWQYMMIGRLGFALKDGKLEFRLAPILTGEMFNEDNEVKFKLFNSIKITYSNPKRSNTFGPDAVQIKEIYVDDLKYHKTYFEEAMAKAIRNKSVKDIKVIFDK